MYPQQNVHPQLEPSHDIGQCFRAGNLKGNTKKTMLSIRKQVFVFGLMLTLMLLFPGGQATPMKRRCIQFGTTSTTNTQQQNGQDFVDEYDEYYEAETSEEPVFEKNISTVVTCSQKAPYCYTVWTYDTVKNASRVVVQGCWAWTDDQKYCSNAECISTSQTPTKHFFCCCNGDSCNGNFTYRPPPTSADGLSMREENANITPFAPYTSIWSSPTVYICFALLAIMLLGIVGFLSCRRLPKKGAAELLEHMQPSGPGYSSNLYNVDNLKLVSMIGQGKYGTVWKGIVNEQPVAVKIFAAQHRQYFLNERDIYTVPLMESPTLLTYFGSDERRTMDDRVEYLLVLSLAPLGCLQDWLTDNRVSFSTFCRMGKSIANGLAHLHTEIRKGDLVKPCICHRDLNSRNILVKSDLSCCIGDLGFALKTFGARYEYRGEITLAETKSINEVGTVRYMAPEVLEGAVNLRDCESALKQIDVYTLALVLWELANRCEDFYPDGTSVPEYRAPYEEYVGSNPSFEQMQVLVSRNKARPSFPAHFGASLVTQIVRDTCEDCWDHDAEARLTAMCVQERLQEIAQINPSARSMPVKACSHDDGTAMEKNQLYQLENDGAAMVAMMGQHQRYSPDGTIAFMTPPNQQIIPQLPPVGYRDDTTGSYKYGKLCDGNNSTTNSGAPSSQSDEDEQHTVRKGQAPLIQKDVCFANGPGKGLGGSVKVMLQKTFHKNITAGANNSSLLGRGYNAAGRHNCDDGDDRSNLVVVVETTDPYPHAQRNALLSQEEILMNHHNTNQQQNLQCAIERPTNLDLGTGKYESNLLLHEPQSVGNVSATDGAGNPRGRVEQYAKALADADFTRQSFAILDEVDGNTVDGTSTVAPDPDPHQKLRIVISKSANAMHPHKGGAHARQGSDSSSPPPFMDDRSLKRQRSLEVFHEVFGPKGSIERLRNPSQRVKTPGDVPPSVRKVRASKTLSLYDDRMMTATVANGNRLANSV
ncbi:bone morphogenetic protein receptor type-2 [Anopheles funestus]|uniref:bone morphogenetic protein receptor type-2 n=1 Tax=Anopheles funestus TaxID=62324 RepID=UPI0020C64D4D|nr:bone morphogenetic protein receptor type-2 [Anopheles funestus]XP_049293646.1 bone morphogenetic protein receptor type-2 [Anopheles funestus]XP_049293647.1 bone morphogenetic protein receptor type-2 [Anopheles funestus]XP_049293648.1 bone morphogenetic protein receptor type-2 [Anopheles funestus]